MAELIDVFERYQGPINWSQVRADGVEMAYVKLTNAGDVASPPGDHYVQGCRASGVIPGGYAYVLGGDPVHQAAVFAGELLRLGLADPTRDQLPPMCDFEDASLPTDPAARRGWILAFMGYLAKLIPMARQQMLYSSANELNAIDTGQLAVPGVHVWIWDAEWGPNDGQNHGITAFKGAVAVHQYTSRGKLLGVGGLVDRDQVLVNITEAPITPPGPGPIPPGTYLRIGSRGPYVTELQETLNRTYPLYSHLVVDDIYGPLTAGVVREFQQRDHILVDGIAGPQTLHALGLQ